MSLINQIKQRFAERKLAKIIKNQASRTVKTSNFQTAENVGLIYLIKDENDYKKVIKLSNYLKSEFGIRNIKSLVYFPFKEEATFLQSKVSLDYFTKKELSFSLQPTSLEVTNFINEPFDILIDLSCNKSAPLKFISLLSKSHLKIGRYTAENEPYYDLMIAEPTDDDFETYVNDIVKYLNLLKDA